MWAKRNGLLLRYWGSVQSAFGGGGGGGGCEAVGGAIVLGSCLVAEKELIAMP